MLFPGVGSVPRRPSSTSEVRFNVGRDVGDESILSGRRDGRRASAHRRHCAKTDPRPLRACPRARAFRDGRVDVGGLRHEQLRDRNPCSPRRGPSWPGSQSWPPASRRWRASLASLSDDVVSACSDSRAARKSSTFCRPQALAALRRSDLGRRTRARGQVQ